MDVRIAIVMFSLASLAISLGCSRDTAGNRMTGGARVESEHAATPPTTTVPQRVYVTDFKLDAQATEHKSGILERPRFLKKMVEDDPETRARKIVDQMANSLVRDLREAGISAQRLGVDAPMPIQGWVVRGVFTEADSGDVPRRAIIGFGAGKTDMEVQVGISDIETNPHSAFIVFGTISDPSKLPGGVVTRNPYVVAAKFVMEQGASTHDVQHTAKAISDEIVKVRGKVARGDVAAPANR
jgi:hypothetical protein